MTINRPVKARAKKAARGRFLNSKRMARTLDNLHPAYLRKYTIATMMMRVAVAAVSKIAR